MCKPDVPSPPDPNVVAAAQTASNKETAITNADLNRIGQNTPYGRLSYEITGTSPNGNPQYTQNVTLSPEQQGLYDRYTKGQTALADTAIGSLDRVQGNFGQPFSLRNDPTQTDFSGQMNKAQDAAYGAATRYLDPQFARGQQNLDAKLANQGLQIGNEAYDNAQTAFGEQRSQSYDQARDLAYNQGLQAQNQGFNQGLKGAELQFALRNMPLSEYNALITGSQPTNPSFGNVPGVQQANTDIAGIQNQGYQNQMAAWDAGNTGINNLFSLGGKLGSAAILASDRRLKRDIERIGTTTDGIPIYEFSYIWDDQTTRHIGVLADEVRPIMPAAVITHPTGYEMVDYSLVRP